MASRIEDYALLGDCQGAALVGKDGSIDWLCLPRFDSDACFAALLGTEDNGFWRIAPASKMTRSRRRYREGTLTLETELTTDDGVVLLVDFMAMAGPGVFAGELADPVPDLVRIVVGVSGSVPMRMDLVLRPGYGRTVPWVRRTGDGITAVSGPDRFRLTTKVDLRGEDLRTIAEFTVQEGERVPFVLGWSPSNLEPAAPIDAESALLRNDAFWTEWSGRAKVAGPYAELVRRSLLTLKALIYEPTGGIVAAPTTSLPEQLGSVRNWDYRFCWVRDAAFTLYALLNAGYLSEAKAWCDWLLRAAAGAPSQLQILYGIAGERRLVEVELPWLEGYENSRPVRIGNLAADQLQLDVYGELIGALHACVEGGLAIDDDAWSLLRALATHLEGAWQQPDSGIWEVRGPARHFTHSKVMCWLAFRCVVQAIETHGFDGPLDRWRAVRDEIHADICAKGFDVAQNSFVQTYGSTELDASLLLLVPAGFLPPSDPRLVGTVDAIQKGLVKDGLVRRYIPKASVDGLPEGEGAFLACSFWLADALVVLGRVDEAHALFDHLASHANDLGLFSEEYDPVAKRMLGNFPQALSHVALVNTALRISRARP